MIIYFAGNVTPLREKLLISLQTNRLFSYYYHGNNKEFYDEFAYRIKIIREGKNELLSSTCS